MTPAMEDSYRTIAHESKVETKVKGSRFIGEVFEVPSVEQAMAKLDEVRKREYSATHHCYAYIVGLDREEAFKYSDDGEPGGTAGRPIYDVVGGTEITNVLCVVTRYFGGTKLGTGGLVRAYSEAAREAMAAAGVQDNFLKAHFRFTIDFPLYDLWQNGLRKLGAEVVDSDFSDTVKMEVEIRKSRAEQLRDLFIEITAGKGQFEEI